MKNNETTKKEWIINGVLIAAGIGTTAFLGIEIVKHFKLVKELKNLNIRAMNALEQSDKLLEMYRELEKINQDHDTIRLALQEVYGNEE